MQRLDDIAVPVPLRRLNRLADHDFFRGEVQDAIKRSVAEQFRCDIDHVGLDEPRAGRHRVGVARRQIVDDDDLVSLLHQHLAHTLPT